MGSHDAKALWAALHEIATMPKADPSRLNAFGACSQLNKAREIAQAAIAEPEPQAKPIEIPEEPPESAEAGALRSAKAGRKTRGL